MNPRTGRRLVKAGFWLVVAFGILAGLFLWACGGIQRPRTTNGQVYDYGTPEAAANGRSEITILTWNISYAYGAGSEGEGYVTRPAAEVTKRVDGIAKAIRESGADIVLLQEVDFDSRRSAHIDELERIAKAAGYRYAARAVTWKAGYVPYPYWPPSRNFGPVRSGGGILSKYPIKSNRVTLYPKPASNSGVYNAFYLFRFTETVEVDFAGRKLTVLNNHLEAYDKANREAQAQALAAVLGADSQDGTVIAGGDFNSVPPEASKKANFADGPDNYEGDTTIDTLRAVAGMKEVVEKEEYARGERKYFTFPSSAPTRRLDYIFVPSDAVVKEVQVGEAGELSDHLPLMAKVALGK